MGDYAKWGYAIAEVLGIGGENFLALYKENQTNISRELLYANQTAKAIMEFMKNRTVYKKSVDSLWKELEFEADVHGINTYEKDWPRSASAFSRQLNLIKINLEQQGYYFSIKNIGSNKEIRLENRNITTKNKKSKGNDI